MQCSICLQAPDQPTTQPCCGNVFCSQCLTNWKQVKNTCPLCAAQLQGQNINKLKNCEEDNQFDDGFLILETQIQQLRHRIEHVKQRIYECRHQSHKMKSMFSASHITFLDDQFQLIKQYHQQIEQAWLTHNRIVCVEFLQLTAELLLSVESALNGSIKESYYDMEEQYQAEYQEYDNQDNEEDDDNFYSMYEQFQSRKQSHKQKKISKLSGTSQKNKSIKDI